MTMTESVNHRDLYKQTGSNGTPSISSLRHCVSFSVRQEQSRQRQNILYQRRFKVKTAHFEEECLSELEDEELVVSNVKLLKQGKRIQALRNLSNAFTRLAKNADLFLRCDGFQSLLNCFTSSNVEVLQEAAWCTVNLTAGASASEQLMTIASTLLQFLQSSDPLMQELCAWALGNLAGDSSVNANVLQSQGCVHALMDLISSMHHMSAQPLCESVLFTLINMAATSFKCVEDMQANQLFEVVERMFKITDAKSSLTLQLAWLTNCIYSREETFAKYPEQYPTICHLVSGRLSELLRLENESECEKPVFPFIHCFANMMAMDAELVETTVENNLSVLSSLSSLLMSMSEIIVEEALRTLINCSVILCNRVLISFHPKLCSAIISVCHHNNSCLAVQALTVMEGLTKTSSFVDCHLVGQGVITELMPLVQSGDGDKRAVTDAALIVLKNLLSSCPEAQEELKGLHIQ